MKAQPCLLAHYGYRTNVPRAAFAMLRERIQVQQIVPSSKKGPGNLAWNFDGFGPLIETIFEKGGANQQETTCCWIKPCVRWLVTDLTIGPRFADE